MPINDFGLRQRRGAKNISKTCLHQVQHSYPVQTPKNRTIIRRSPLETLLNKTNHWEGLQKSIRESLQNVLGKIDISALGMKKESFNQLSFSRSSIHDLWETIKKETQKGKSEIEQLALSVSNIFNQFSGSEQAFIKMVGSEVAKHHMSQAMLTIAAKLSIPAPLMILLPLVLQAKMSKAEETPQTQYSIHKGVPTTGYSMCETHQSPSRLSCEEVFVLESGKSDPIVQLSSDFIATENWASASDAAKQEGLQLYQSCEGVDQYIPKLQNALSQKDKSWMCNQTLACGPEILDGLKPEQIPIQTSKMSLKGFCYDAWYKYIQCPDYRCAHSNWIRKSEEQERLYKIVVFGVLGGIVGAASIVGACLLHIACKENKIENSELKAKLKPSVKELPLSDSEKNFDDDKGDSKRDMIKERNEKPITNQDSNADKSPPIRTVSQESVALDIGVVESSSMQIEMDKLENKPRKSF